MSDWPHFPPNLSRMKEGKNNIKQYLHVVGGDELQVRLPELCVDVEVVGRVLAHFHQLALHLREVHGQPMRRLVRVARYLSNNCDTKGSFALEIVLMKAPILQNIRENLCTFKLGDNITACFELLVFFDSVTKLGHPINVISMDMYEYVLHNTVRGLPYFLSTTLGQNISITKNHIMKV